MKINKQIIALLANIYLRGLSSTFGGLVKAYALLYFHNELPVMLIRCDNYLTICKL